MVADDPEIVAAADKIVLPGVGAFGMPWRSCGGAMVEPDRGDRAGKPFLGICLGLQLLFDVSYEDGEHRGAGRSCRARWSDLMCREYKVPHMGWNQAQMVAPAPILEGIDEGTHFYFVHSYYVVPRDGAWSRSRRTTPAVLRHGLARKPLRHAIPPGEEPGGRIAYPQELSGALSLVCLMPSSRLAPPCHSPFRVSYYEFS